MPVRYDATILLLFIVHSRLTAISVPISTHSTKNREKQGERKKEERIARSSKDTVTIKKSLELFPRDEGSLC